MTTDPAAAFAGGTWNRDALDDHGGSLPKGQGVDALFYGGQLATIQYGRWILPNLKKLKNLQYDICSDAVGGRQDDLPRRGVHGGHVSADRGQGQERGTDVSRALS